MALSSMVSMQKMTLAAAISSGDINGDGIADLLIGAPYAPGLNKGQSYVVFGSRTPFPASFNLASLMVPMALSSMGINMMMFGWSISSGDINGDGITDLLIGASLHWGNHYQVKAMWCMVRVVPFQPVLIWQVLMVIMALSSMVSITSDYSGYSISSGDINGDGIADLLIGAYQTNSR